MDRVWVTNRERLRRAIQRRWSEWTLTGYFMRPLWQRWSTARFRNVLTHTYGDAIDHDDVYDALQDLNRYRDFLIDIRTYLREQDVLDD